jgi:hypothetical protein
MAKPSPADTLVPKTDDQREMATAIAQRVMTTLDLARDFVRVSAMR